MMFTPEALLGLAMVLSLGVYAVTGGADYGGGVWDLCASGPRAAAQRALIADAIGPIWEANHVWLILVVVLLFSAFPAAFAAMTTALHIPLTLMLLCIVLRGAAFTFRSYDDQRTHRRWGAIFAIASLVTPVLLGVNLGALAHGGLRIRDGVVLSGFVAPWLHPFAFAVGALALSLFAFLAAVYLAVEAKDQALAGDFRRRALASGAAAALVAVLTLALARSAAPILYAGMKRLWGLHVLTALVALLATWALWRRRYRLARAGAAAQVGLIILGWGLAQQPYLIVPDLDIHNAAAPPQSLRLLILTLGLGSLLLLPSFFYLFRVFKAAHDAPQRAVDQNAKAKAPPAAKPSVA